MQSTEYRHYWTSVIFSIVLAVVVAVFLLTYGKNDSFFVINKNNHPSLDHFFRFWTYLGDGLIWVPVFVYTIIFRRDFLVAIIASVVISTILTHFFKRVVFPDDFRPIVVLGEEKIRIIQGYKMNRANSFPSGHTSTAFTLALLMAFIVRKKIWLYVFPLIAFFVGYSRVYLAQHFVTDVFAGMLIGIVSSYLSLLVYEKFRKKKKEKQALNEVPAGRG